MTLIQNSRVLNLVGFAICVLLLAYAYYTQFYQYLEPCPLCIFQRIGMMALGAVFLIAAIHTPRGRSRRVYSMLIALAAAAGASVSARHVWLQNLPPDQVPACGPGLNYMLEVFPLGEALRMAFTGSGECADVDWSFLGLSMPAWVMAMFVMLGVFGFWNNWRKTA